MGLSATGANAVCTFGMLLLPGFNGLAAGAFIDPFRAANYLNGSTLYAWPYFSPDGGPVAASNGMETGGTTAVSDTMPEVDFLIVNASWAPEQARAAPIQHWLRRAARAGTVLGGLDTGAFVLAYAGLMKGYRAAVHYEHIAAYRELFPDSPMDESIFVIDRDRMTCCGGLAASDLALEIIRLQHGIDLANAAARYVFHDRLRAGDEGQLPAQYEPVGYAAPRLLRAAIILMERTLEHPLSIGEIVEEIGLSQKQLERLFKAHTGVTPLRYYVDVRLDRARGLVTQTDLPIVEVAAACGFGSAAQFTRTYKRRFGVVPRRDRIEGRVPLQFRSFPSHLGLGRSASDAGKEMPGDSFGSSSGAP